MFESKLEFVKELKNQLQSKGLNADNDQSFLKIAKELTDWIESVIISKDILYNDQSLADQAKILIEDGEKYRKLKELINQ